jgi:hypothetical protein
MNHLRALFDVALRPLSFVFNNISGCTLIL